MTEEKSQEIKKVDNSAYRDKFRFLLYVNDNVIVERFFKINGFNSEVLHSSELRDAIYEIVFRNPNANNNEDEKLSLRDDLISKSRVYEWYTVDTPFKMTGFKENGTGYKNGRECKYFEVKSEDFDPKKLVFASDYETKIYSEGQPISFKHEVDNSKMVVEQSDGSYKELNLINIQTFSNYDVYNVEVSFDGITHQLTAYRSIMVCKPVKGATIIQYYRWNDNDEYIKVAEYLKYDDVDKDELQEEEDNSRTDFKFSLQAASEVKYVDERPVYDNYKPIYECYFDFNKIDENGEVKGSMLPRYIRTNVNIANTQFQDKTKAPYYRDIDKKLVADRADLIYYTIKSICDVTNLGESEDKTYIKLESYPHDKNTRINGKRPADKIYSFYPMNKKVVDGWRAYTKEKTDKYFRENFHISPDAERSKKNNN